MTGTNGPLTYKMNDCGSHHIRQILLNIWMSIQKPTSAWLILILNHFYKNKFCFNPNWTNNVARILNTFNHQTDCENPFPVDFAINALAVLKINFETCSQILIFLPTKLRFLKMLLTSLLFNWQWLICSVAISLNSSLLLQFY